MLNVYEELGESSRRQILAELRSGPKSVTDLVVATGLKQPNVSNHLARLRAKGVVMANKLGRQVFYALSSPEVEAVVQTVFTDREFNDESLNLEEQAKIYAKAAISGDESACNEILDLLYRHRLSMIEIYQDVLAPAMVLIGTWYKVEAIDEAQEHMASAITERMMSRVVQMTTPSARHGKVVVLGAAANSWHTIGIRMLSDFLRVSGWKTLFLGANVPVNSFVAAVRQHKAEMVLVSCAAVEGVQDAIDLVSQLAALRTKKNRLIIGVGGQGVSLYPNRFLSAGADFTAKDLKTFASEVLPSIESSGRAQLGSGSLAAEN